jgi:hypothetical protein
VERPRSRSRRSMHAPKGQKDSAQGFNPGYLVLTECALKVAPDLGVRDRTIRSTIRGSDLTARAPLSGRIVRTRNPGLKPWAKFFCPFGASDRPRRALPDNRRATFRPAIIGSTAC